jgi:hypothetical protein
MKQIFSRRRKNRPRRLLLSVENPAVERGDGGGRSNITPITITLLPANPWMLYQRRRNRCSSTRYFLHGTDKQTPKAATISLVRYIL